MTLCGSPMGERAEPPGTSDRPLYRKAVRFDREGMESLFDTTSSERRKLPPVLRRMIVELKAEYPRRAPRRCLELRASGRACSPHELLDCGLHEAVDQLRFDQVAVDQSGDALHRGE